MILRFSVDQALATNIRGQEYCLLLAGNFSPALTGRDIELSYNMRYTLWGS